ncbi:hypothetical protein H0S70_07210 [Chryseobacterium manosquense]|uniref:Uncharacterized protein n=1 Tax=Chryseobacterium manosquense TaxID=2754694 RepID=A0A7H1DT86_9FLAO|nr:hypothetical protein [Chryseobacterium manosquense]QNS40194.1 hypothetical protein H0S70_07210 [Chryseobacterium manosquense]
MFEKILTELKTKYKNFGLSDTILKAKAKQLAKAVNTEEEIEEAVAGVEDDLAIFQSFADQNRTLAKEIADLKKGKETPEPENPNPANPNDPPKQTGGVPEWAKGFTETIKSLTETLTTMKQEKAQQTNAQKLQSKLEELKVSKSYLDLLPQSPTEMNFQTDEEIELFATGLKSKSDVYEQSISNSALGQTAKPLFGEAGKEGDVSAAMQAYMDSKKPKTNE